MQLFCIHILCIVVIVNVDAVVYKEVHTTNKDAEYKRHPQLARGSQSSSIQEKAAADNQANLSEEAHSINLLHFHGKEDKNHVSSDGFTNFGEEGLPKSNKSLVASKSSEETSSSPRLDLYSLSLDTIGAEKKSSVVKRTINLPRSDLEYGGLNPPFCYDRYVTGNCRYRTDPEYCFQYEWTAYAIVQNFGGGIESIPEGLHVEPSDGRVRVWVKTSCCTPFIKLISRHFNNGRIIEACVIDVRELQGLHPAEIAGIVLGVLFVLIIIIVAIVLFIRKRNTGVASVQNDCPVKSYGYSMRPGATSNSQTTSRIK